MKCSDIKKMLAEYIDGTLTESNKALVEAHVASCKMCAEEVAFLKTYIKEAGSLEKMKAPADFLEKVHERLERRFSFEKLMRTLFVPIRIKVPLELAGVMATLLLAFFVGRIVISGIGEGPPAMLAERPEKAAPWNVTQAKQMAKQAYQHSARGTESMAEYKAASSAAAPGADMYGGYVDYDMSPEGGMSGASSACYYPAEPDYEVPEESIADLPEFIKSLNGKVTSQIYDENTGLLKELIVEVPSGKQYALLGKLKAFDYIISSTENVDAEDEGNRALKIVFK
ncbi:zf-HC2 domain-containing protein [Candidatus Omnitrophota bacterium]